MKKIKDTLKETWKSISIYGRISLLISMFSMIFISTIKNYMGTPMSEAEYYLRGTLTMIEILSIFTFTVYSSLFLKILSRKPLNKVKVNKEDKKEKTIVVENI